MSGAGWGDDVVEHVGSSDEMSKKKKWGEGYFGEQNF